MGISITLCFDSNFLPAYVPNFMKTNSKSGSETGKHLLKLFCFDFHYSNFQLIKNGRLFPWLLSPHYLLAKFGNFSSYIELGNFYVAMFYPSTIILNRRRQLWTPSSALPRKLIWRRNWQRNKCLRNILHIPMSNLHKIVCKLDFGMGRNLCLDSCISAFSHVCSFNPGMEKTQIKCILCSL